MRRPFTIWSALLFVQSAARASIYGSAVDVYPHGEFPLDSGAKNLSRARSEIANRGYYDLWRDTLTIHRWFAPLVLAAALTAPASAGWKGMTMYAGAPDLQVTAEMVAAGGGPEHFDSKKLVGVMAGKNAPAALGYLTQHYGAADVDAFFRTFTYAVNDSLHYATAKGIKLPPATVPSGPVLTQKLYAAGTLPDGMYDPGYMLERLVSHPIHMWVMWDINRQPDLGRKTDETFHIILTDAMHKLANH